MKRTYLVILPLVAAVSACGGSSTSDAAFKKNAFAFTSFDDGFNSLNALGAKIGAASQTPIQDLPVGTARYDGVFVMFAGGTLEDGVNDGVLGQLQLAVDFDSNQFDGEVGSFINDLNNPVAGSLLISNGEIDPGTADVSGNITFQAGAAAVNGVASVEFLGDSGELSGASITGTVQTAGGLADPIPLAGWSVERQ